LQIIERIGPTRQLQSGYDRPVFIHRIIARDTVDELVLERLTTKRRVQDVLLDAMKKRKTNAKGRLYAVEPGEFRGDSPPSGGREQTTTGGQQNPVVRVA
jgi:hypothetical protein